MIGKIYVGYHLTVLHIEYTSSSFSGSREDFSHYKPIWQISICLDYQTLLHTQYRIYGSCVFPMQVYDGRRWFMESCYLICSLDKPLAQTQTGLCSL